VRILIHGINYFPERIGVGKYTGEMASWLAAQGHDVRVVVAPPYYPDWKVGSPYSAWQYRRERIAGVDAWRCPVWVPRKQTGLKRIVHLLSFAASSFPVMLLQCFWKPDVVMAIEPPLFCAPQARLVALLTGAASWLHVQDFEVAAFFGLQFSSRGRLERFFLAVERYLTKSFDVISTISNAMQTRLLGLGIAKNKIFFFPNWVDVHRISPNQRVADLRSEWGMGDGRSIVLYAGNMGNKQGLELVLDAATLTDARDDITWVMVGEGAAKAGLQKECEKRNLRNVVFKPLQPLEQLPALLATADIHLVIQKRGVADAVLPSKLTGILAAGGYTVITADPECELGRFVLGHPGVARLAKPEDASALVETVLETLEARRKSGTYNVVARLYAEEHLAEETIMQSLQEKLLTVVPRRNIDKRL
jgi:colanic acid biosynthesis glycosyl transferase WcaI